MIGEASAKFSRVISASEKKQVLFRMAMGNVELMHECLPKHSGIRTAKNEVRQSEEQAKRREVSMERSTAIKK